MTRPRLRTVFVLMLGLGLAACASSPVRYHTLLAPASSQASTARASVDYLIDVQPVGLPAALDQVQMVVRDGQSNVAVLDSQRWASPFGDEVRGALSASLGRELGTQDVSDLPRPEGQRVLRVKLQIRRADAWLGDQVQFAADWNLAFAGASDKAQRLCHGAFEEPAPGGYEALAQAQQRIVQKLAQRIAADARAGTCTSG